MEDRMKISPKLIVVIAVVLAAIVAVAAWMNMRSVDADADSLAVSADGELVAEYTPEQLMGMKSVTEYAELESSGSGDERGDFTGVRLDALLEDAGVSGYDTVVLTAGDGYSSAADASEADEVIIAYFKDGETLGYYTKGGTGPLRAVFYKDTYGNRSVKYLTKIDAK